MKSCLTFLIIVALGVGGLYIWWQMNATRVLDAQVKTLAENLFSPRTTCASKSKPMKLVGLGQARVPQLLISGTDLRLRNGGRIASAKLVLKNLEVTGPPFHFSGVGGGYYAITATDKDVTAYLHKRGISLHGLATIPLDSLTITFSRRNGTTMRGLTTVDLPFLHKKISMAANGDLVPASKNDQLDFRVKSVKLADWQVGEKHISDSLGALNPVLDLSDWPLVSEIKSVKTGDGIVVFRGQDYRYSPQLPALSQYL